MLNHLQCGQGGRRELRSQVVERKQGRIFVRSTAAPCVLHGLHIHLATATAAAASCLILWRKVLMASACASVVMLGIVTIAQVYQLVGALWNMPPNDSISVTSAERCFEARPPVPLCR